METKNQKSVNSGKLTFVNPRVLVSSNGEYVTLVTPGNVAVRKHVNYLKAVLGIPFEPKVKAQTTEEIPA